MSIDLTKKSSRLLASRRYTHDDSLTSQEAFTQVLDLGSDEIYSQTNAIPTSSLPFSGSSQQRSGSGVIKYYYRQKLTPSENTSNNEVWFFLDPLGSDSGIGTQLIDDNQLTNFISPKYSIATLALNQTEDNTPGYGVTVLKSTSLNSASLTAEDRVSANDYQFDYKTGVLQFEDNTVDPANNEYVYLTAYQYIGTTVTDTSSSLANRITTDSSSLQSRITIVENGSFTNISASGAITASDIRVESDIQVAGDVGIGGSIFSLAGFGITIDDVAVTSGSVNFGSGSINPAELDHKFTGSVSITGSLNADSFTGIFIGAVSSSTQIASAISGASNTVSHSLQGRIATIEGTDAFTGGFTANAISGAFNAPSSSFSTRVTILEDTASDRTFNHITASGNISASALLFASVSLGNNSVASQTVMYDTSSGRFYFTGSYGGGGSSTVDNNLESVSTDVLPATDNLTLGSATNKWNAIFATDTFFGGIHEINLETIGISQLQTGTVLVSKAGQMVPCNVQADPLVMGIVTSGSNYPVIMGAEPVLVDGAVYEGDYIITSDRIGYGKAIPPDQIFEQKLFGKIIAQSLETNLSGGSIKAMIRKM